MRHDSHYVEEFARTPNRSVGRIIQISQIEPNPDQPRVEIGDLTELAESIKQKGVLEPLLVKPNGDGTWMIIAGERRWRASNLAGLREVPCIELDVDEKTIAEIALIENLQRKDLNVWEEADGLAALHSRYGYTHEEIAKKIGKSRSTVTEFFAIAGLPEVIRRKCRQAEISAKSILLEISRQFDEKAMHEFLDRLHRQGDKRESGIRKKSKNAPDTGEAAYNSANARSFKNNSKNNSAVAGNSNTFKFSSAQNNFLLEIQFTGAENFDKRDVLQALKEAFDKTKQSQ